MTLPYNEKIYSIAKSPVPHLQTVWEWDTFIKNFYVPLKPKNVLEIGTFYGATMWAMMHNVYLDKFVSVDLPIPPEDGRYGDMIRSKEIWKQWPDYKSIVSIEGDSHSTRVISDTLNQFPSRDVDVLFIDGDHSYEGVKADYLNFKSLVREGGLIVFHDSVGYNSVKQLCDEIRLHQTRCVEISEKNGWGLFILEK